LYPSIEEKAGNLLYFITKNHSFTDGNKRIAAFLFLYFMEKNGILFDANGNKRIANNALVALCCE
jgi:prophage maintenance system killer protein